MKKIVVFYHDDPDGFGAAWAARRKLGARADYIERRNSAPANLKLRNKTIYFLDTAYPEKDLKFILQKNRKIILIDHHKSRINFGNFLPGSLLDTKHSSAVLTWKYFHPGRPAPRILRHVEDYDLWKFKMSHTREISAAINAYPNDFKTWNKIASDLENPRLTRKYIDQGKAIVAYSAKIVREAVSSGEEVIFDNHRALAVNASPAFRDAIGDYGKKIKKYPLVAIWSRNKDEIRVSLRSDKRVDASKIAEKYGSGGHKQSAAFSIKLGGKFPWKKVKHAQI